jgi:histidine ammonia-lyase/tyrosine ammonia-lyase
MLITGESMSVFDVYDVAVKGQKVALAAKQLERVIQACERVQAWGMARYPIYGVNTGFGELAHIIVPPDKKSQLQENLIRSHAAGAGEPFSDEVVRAIMVVRLNCLMKGYSGVSGKAVELLAAFLNQGIHPMIPRKGSLGASGDLAPLAHMALALIGEGEVRVAGKVRPAQEVFKECGFAPLELGFKEALALMNGTSGMTGVACLAYVQGIDLMKLAVLASADVVQCLGASTRAFDHRGHALKNHAGQIQIAAVLRELLHGSKLTREHGDIMQAIYERTREADGVVDPEINLQNAYSLRCMPQILGPVLETLSFCRRVIEEEVNSCNDNPLFFDEAEESFHGGHFHGQYVAMASDFLNIALTEIGILAERQLNRIVDPYINGRLPAFLASSDAGLFCGFEGAQYLATSLASENLGLCAPASVKSIPSNGQNQDIVSMGLISARKTMEIAENVNSILATLIGACHQAAQMIGFEHFSEVLQIFHKMLAPGFPLYRDDRPMFHVIEGIKTRLHQDDIHQFLDRYCRFQPLEDTVLSFKQGWQFGGRTVGVDAQ